MWAIWQRELKISLTRWHAVFYLSLILILSYFLSIQFFWLFPYRQPQSLQLGHPILYGDLRVSRFLSSFTRNDSGKDSHQTHSSLYYQTSSNSFPLGQIPGHTLLLAHLNHSGYFLLSFMQPSLFLPKEGWKTVFVLFSLTTFYAGLIILWSTIFTHPFFLMIVGLSYSLFLLIGSILYLIQPDFLPPQIQLFLPLYWIQLPQVLYLLVPVSSGLIFSLIATTLLNRKDL